MNERDNTTPQQGNAGPTQQAAIDVEKLAEKVYQLMRAEARLARTRSQTRKQRG